MVVYTIPNSARVWKATDFPANENQPYHLWWEKVKQQNFQNKQKYKSSFLLANLSGNKRSATFTLCFLLLFLIRRPFLSTSSHLDRNLSKFLSKIKHPVIFCTLALPLSLSVSLAVLFPLPLPLAWSWLPGSWGLAKACVPEGASEEMERGGRAGAERQAPKPHLRQPCLAFLSPVRSLTSLGFARSWPGTRPSSAINQRRGVVCAFVLIENWLERGWYGDQDLPTKHWSSPSERTGEGVWQTKRLLRRSWLFDEMR